jgi:glycerol-3-phosphate acyltransferase PlsY
MIAILAALAVALAYLLGSIPFGVIATRVLAGVDIRDVGSGRTGATNVYRAAGAPGLLLTSLGDILKGMFAIWIARVVMTYAITVGAGPVLVPWIEALAGIAVVGGHNWSVFLKFKGGAGTATSIGVLTAMNLYVALGSGAVGLTAIVISHMASVGSISIALAQGPALAISAALGATPWAYLLFGIVGGAFTVYALLPNIRRILQGRERRLKTNS